MTYVRTGDYFSTVLIGAGLSGLVTGALLAVVSLC